ncbi:MAG: collagen-like protein [Candidatus Neomarinimicrobiota bacterium]
MKKFSVLLSLVALAIIFAGCEGPAGADGTAGADGIAGVDGTDGTDGLPGVDINETCKVCHADGDTPIKAMQVQWAASLHAGGGNFERNGTSCAPCHVSQGFIEVLSTGADTTVADISNPAPINCRTCHTIHTAYDLTDWAFRVTEAVTTLQDPTATIDLGKANLCASCHQARAATIPAVTAAITDSITVTSSRYGPHHGPQSNLLAGVAAGWKVAGSKTYANSAHTSITDGCVACHMADAYGAQAGGHTMALIYDYHGSDRFNEAGCESCHPDGGDEEITTLTAEIQPLLDGIETILIARGVLTATGSAVAQKMNAIEAGALYNYRMVVLEDRSMGAHNPKYIVALLTNTKEALDDIDGQ